MKGREQRQAKGKRAKVVSNERMRRERERGKGGKKEEDIWSKGNSIAETALEGRLHA